MLTLPTLPILINLRLFAQSELFFRKTSDRDYLSETNNPILTGPKDINRHHFPGMGRLILYKSACVVMDERLGVRDASVGMAGRYGADLTSFF